MALRRKRATLRVRPVQPPTTILEEAEQSDTSLTPNPQEEIAM